MQSVMDRQSSETPQCQPWCANRAYPQGCRGECQEFLDYVPATLGDDGTCDRGVGVGRTLSIGEPGVVLHVYGTGLYGTGFYDTEAPMTFDAARQLYAMLGSTLNADGAV